MDVLQILEKAHERFGSHGGVERLYYPEWASVAY